MKKIFTGILLFLCSFMIINAEELDFNVSSNKINKGDNLSIYIEPYDGNINVTYDKNIFEEIDASNIKSAQVNSYENNTFHLNDKSSIQINLKVKDTAKKGKTTIVVNYGNESLSKDINIDKNNSSIFIIFGLISVALIICGIVYYNKNKISIKKEQIIILSVISVLAVLSLILCIVNLNINLSKKEDVNYKFLIDNKIDDNDDNENNENNNENNNNTENNENDNNVETEEKEEVVKKPVSVNYKVDLKTFTTDIKTIAKNNDVMITFSASVSPNKDIKSVVINNKTYIVKKVGKNYQVVISSLDKYGNQKYTITHVILKNGKKIKVTNKNIEIYVLKTEPSIENVNIDKRQEIPVLSFDVEDIDNTVISGKVVMMEVNKMPLLINNIGRISTDITNNNENILLEESIKVGHNTFKVPNLKEGMSYNLEITLEYSLSENKEDVNYLDELEENKEELFEREYNFKLIDEEITSIVTSNDTLNLSFKNGEYSYKDLEKITIDGKEYNLVKNEDTYSVKDIDKCKTKGKCKLHITSVKVITENGVIKEIPCDYKIDYIYLKEKPTIENFTTTYNDNKLTGNYIVNDIDDTIESGLLTFEGPSDTKSIELTKEELKSNTFTKEVNFEKSGDYKVTLTLIYDLGDTNKLNDVKIESSNLVHQNITAVIKNINVQEKVARGSKAAVYFTIESNTDETVQSITIDNKVYNLEKQSNGTYKATVDVPESGSGLTRVLKATKLTYSKEEITINNDIVVEILKLVPRINTFTLSALGGQIYGEFTLNDVDTAVIAVKYTINGVTREITSDEFKSLKFRDNEVRTAGNYEVTLTLIYDLGNGIAKTDISTKENVKVEVDANITESVVNPEYVQKGESITITYTVKDNTDSELSKININGTDYTVNSLGNDKYTVSIDIAEDEASGKKEFTATTLTYADGETFTHSNVCSVTVLKEEPTIGETLSTNYDKSAKTLTGNISVSETEDTIVNATLTITGPCFSKPYVATISKIDLLNGTFKIENLELSKMGDYTISLVVTYNLGEKDIETTARTSTVHIDLESKIITVTAPSVINKNQNKSIELVYKIEDNTDIKVYKMKINDEVKFINNSSSDDTYKAIISLKDNNYGMHTITTSALIYSINQSDTEIAVSKETQVYVLKDKPELENITYNYEADTLYANLSITDNDNSKTSTNITFTKGEDTKTVTSTDNKIDISSLENGKYNVKVEINYDLDEENSFDGSTGVITKEYKDVNIITNYNPTIESFELYDITEDTVKLKAKIINDTESQITNVKLNNESYEVTSFTKLDGSDNEYIIELINPSERVELNITSIIFDTGYEKTITSSGVLINKKTPTATVKTQIVDENKVKVTINTTDDDKTLDKENYYAVLKTKDTDEEIERIKISDQTEITFTKSLEGTVNYKVEISANYNLVDGETHINELLATSSENLIIPAKITYKSMSLPTSYSHTNNKEFTIKFNFESNVNLVKNNVLNTIKIHTSEYDPNTDGLTDNSKDGKNYVKVNIDDKDEDYTINCTSSTKREDEDIYDSECKISYVVVGQSSVIKVKPISYTYNDSSQKMSPTLTAIDGGETKLIDVVKWHPSFKYSIENEYKETGGKIIFRFKFLEDVSMLEPFKDNVYLKFEYGLERQEFNQELVANHEYTVTFDNVKPGPGKRFVVSAYFDQYHGDIVNKNTTREKEITIASFIHSYYDQKEPALNNIKLVSEEGDDINELIEGEQAKLSFEIDGSNYNPTEMTITIDDNNTQKYNVVSDSKGGYVTEGYLPELSSGTHKIKITNLTVKSISYSVTKNNEIEVTVKPTGTGISLSIPNKTFDLKTNQKLIFENKENNRVTNKEINTEILKKENSNVENIEENNLTKKEESNANESISVEDTSIDTTENLAKEDSIEIEENSSENQEKILPEVETKDLEETETTDSKETESKEEIIEEEQNKIEVNEPIIEETKTISELNEDCNN